MRSDDREITKCFTCLSTFLDDDLRLPITGFRKINQAAIQKLVLGLPVRRLSVDSRAGFVLKLDKHLSIDDRTGIPNVLKQE